MARASADLPLLSPLQPAAAAVLTVSRLCAQLKRSLEQGFAQVVVQGEISGAKLNGPSGHFYGNLKDEAAVISLTMWQETAMVFRMMNGRLPQDGDLVVVTGRVTVYPQRGQMQLNVERMELAGQGAILQRIEALKQKLAAEGLFDAARKKPLPYLPARVGIVTSPSGAVIQDMLHRIEERCPRHVMLWPVAVQGPTAASEVAGAVDGFNQLPDGERPDVLIVARGGGSIDDLMAFNDERVVRAVAASGIPVISGVGHEPDVTLCDFAADVRAPTPTAAAEYAVPVRDELLDGLAMAERRLKQALRGHVSRGRERLDYLARLLPQPRRALEALVQRLDEAAMRLTATAPRLLRERVERVDVLGRLLGAVNPALPLERGYALVRDPRGGVVDSAQTAGHDVVIQFKDGKREAVLR